MTDKPLSERVAELERERDAFVQKYDEAKQRAAIAERTLADVTKERESSRQFEDAWNRITDALDGVCGKHRWMSEDGDATSAEEAAAAIRQLGRRLESASAQLATAERRATEANNLFAQRASVVRAEAAREAFVEGAGWLHAEAYRLGLYRENVAVPEPGGVVRVMGYSAKDEARRRYPAVPTEREGAGHVHDPLCVCGHGQSAHVYHEGPCRSGVACPAKCKEYRPTPPQAAPEPSTAELGEYEVRYVAGHLPWKAERVHLVGGTIGRVKSASCHSLPSLLDCLGVTPTADQYAAMLRLMETGRRASGREG